MKGRSKFSRGTAVIIEEMYEYNFTRQTGRKFQAGRHMWHYFRKNCWQIKLLNFYYQGISSWVLLLVAPSNNRSRAFASSPPAKPVSEPEAPTTR